ncbi:MAG TPA: hypothetical protein VGO55_08370 [Allosphingosinicella sp.]|nr:hypothetical protein [Allosphingosinicella sp.]
MLKRLLLILALAAPAAAPAQPPGWRLTPDGYGPVRIGMTRAQVSSALSTRLEGDAIEDEEACIEMAAATGYSGLYFMFEQGRLSRISATEPSQATTTLGVGIGATAERVRRAYGPGVRSETHEYLGRPAEYLTFWRRGSAHGIRFETDSDRRVTAIHVGGSSIRYVEGCA